jgi:hypothetical protein
MLVRVALVRQLAFAAALAGCAGACAAHAGGATHPESKTPRVERSCAQAEAGRPAPLRIVAVDETGAPLVHASVTIADAGKASGVGALLETDERGEAEAGVLSGLWRVEVALPGYATAGYLLDLEGAQACSLRFALERAPNEFEF